MATLRLLIAAFLVISTTAFLRLLYMLRYIRTPPNTIKQGPSHMVIVLGSGGHTAEMISLMRGIDPTRYKHRTYIVSSGDSFSSSKAFDTEQRVQANAKTDKFTEEGINNTTTGIWEVKVVPRARKIHQPLYTAPVSSLWCLLGCFKVLFETAGNSGVSPGRRRFPDVIVTNGPATAVIFIFAAAILKFLGVAPLSSMKIIYVESWARVATLSLSGKILLRLGICEKFIVQWEGLARKLNSGPRGGNLVEWHGFLVD